MAESSQPKKSLPKINPIDQPYWQGAAASRLLLQKCKDCGKLQFFPRPVCLDCFSGNLEWVQASGKGKIHSFTWVRVPRSPAFKGETPICYINVILDEGVIMESRLLGNGAEGVKLGDRVKVAFQETHDPAIKLPVFELEGQSARE
ncbi:MAG: Zn-ribbon domain-containing OB-fold protein [Candidatus Binatia bacterium]